METVELLKRKIKTVEDLRSLVKTLKTLAAVNIRQYEGAVYSLIEYNRTVELGLQIVLQSSSNIIKSDESRTEAFLGAIVFGSDQGMCGQLNDQIVSHAVTVMNKMGIRHERRKILAVGVRASTRLENSGQIVDETLGVPGSLSSITLMVQDLLSKINDWNQDPGIDRVFLFYNSYHFGKMFYHPYDAQLLPVSSEFLENLKNRRWPSKVLPTYTMDLDELFSSLIREYLFVSLYRSIVESMASENAGRLASMQRAEKNIIEHLEELNLEFHKRRQMEITEELLDIVSGYESASS